MGSWLKQCGTAVVSSGWLLEGFCMADQNSSLESNYHAPVMGLVSVSGRPGGQQGRQEETSQVGFSMKSLKLWTTWS